jgi:polysaccharide biosynthesis protein PslA
MDQSVNYILPDVIDSVPIDDTPVAHQFRRYAAPVSDCITSINKNRRNLSKRVFDIVVAVILLIALAIPLAILALLIKMDSRGPILFLQPRIGLDDQVFRVWKFRSMCSSKSDERGAVLTTRNDPRITRIGAWLRRLSIDELPQLFNVLIGDMSLVGPRPHPLEAKVGVRPYADVVQNYHRRHLVRPGITGWAQVNGWRGETTIDEQIEQRVAHDLEYIEKQNLLFDIRILMMTLQTVWKQEAF